MPGIVAACGVDENLGELLERMAGCAPYRGPLRVLTAPGVVLGVQGEFSVGLASVGPVSVAIHGSLKGEPSGQRSAELVAAGLIEQGEAALRRLQGRFAAVVFHSQTGLLYAVRDALGQRPLFYGEGSVCVVASEAHAVLRVLGRPVQLGREEVVRFLFNRRRPASSQWLLEGVARLPPGRMLRVAGAAEQVPGPEVASEPLAEGAAAKCVVGSADVAKRVREAFLNAVDDALPDDAFAVALSGGLDSSAIWGATNHLAARGNARANKGVAYSNVFPGYRCDESGYIEANVNAGILPAIRLNATNIPPHSGGAYLDWLNPFLWHSRVLSEAMAARGVRYLVLGLGGDEFFTARVQAITDLLRSGSITVAWKQAVAFRESLISNQTRSAVYHFAVALSGLSGVRVRSLFPERLPNWVTEDLRDIVGQFGPRERTGRPSVRSALLTAADSFRTGIPLEFYERFYASRNIEFVLPFLDSTLLSVLLGMPPGAWLSEARSKNLLRIALGEFMPSIVRDRTEVTVFDDFVLRAWKWQDIVGSVEGWKLAELGLVRADRLVALWDRAPSEFARLFRTEWLLRMAMASRPT